MDIWGVIGVVVLVIMLAFIGLNFYIKSNHNYSSGSGMFKNSENNLDDSTRTDASDHEYYDDKGQFR